MHKPVLLKESIEGLNLKDGSRAVDATLGGGGHSREILNKIGSSGIFIGIDVDVNSIKNFPEFPISNFQFPNKSQFPIYKIKNTYLIRSNFVNLGEILKELEIEKVDAILADLGYSSMQLEDENVGMSFLKEAPLDMRLNRDGELTAKQIVNEYSQGEIARIIKKYGEDRFAKFIAKKIADYRKTKQIETTTELVEIINSAIPEKFKHGKLHPATKTFQALRIEVNHELEVLEKFIPQAIESLAPGGRLVIIAFHSLEDRIVKSIFREYAKGCICPKEFPICQCENLPKIKTINKKPIIPTAEEMEENPKSRSAKMRICEKL